LRRFSPPLFLSFSLFAASFLLKIQTTKIHERTLFHFKVIDVILPPSRRMSSDLSTLSSRYVHIGDLRKTKPFTARTLSFVFKPILYRSHEKVAVCQNLGLDMNETGSPEMQQRRVAGFHRGLSL